MSDRSNVDFQFLMCAPVEPAEVAKLPQPGGASQLAQVDPLAPAQSTKRRRLTKKTAGATKATPAVGKGSTPVYQSSGRKWLYACGPLQPADQGVVESFQVAFQKAFSMNFYITKYQGKMMESLTPLFHSMLGGMQRLEQQEREEQEEEARKLLSEEVVLPLRRRTQEDLARRARRVCIRLASMANRCFWLSTTEVAVHILTGGDCLQSHHHVRLFTRQLQWACHHCKRQLNHEGDESEEVQMMDQQSIQAIRIQLKSKMARDAYDGQVQDVSQSSCALQPAETLTTGQEQVEETSSAPQLDAAHPADEEQLDDAEVDNMETCTKSTNTADDYAHRGAHLETMPFYVYKMYVRRVLKRSKAKGVGARFFAFDDHYVMAPRYEQEVKLTRMDVPTIDSFQCPSTRSRAELALRSHSLHALGVRRRARLWLCLPVQPLLAELQSPDSASLHVRARVAASVRGDPRAGEASRLQVPPGSQEARACRHDSLFRGEGATESSRRG